MINLGYELYHIHCARITYYLEILTKQHISIYHLKKVGHYDYEFCIRPKDHYRLKKLQLPILYQRSVGPWYVLWRLLHNPVKWVGITCFIVSFLYVKMHILNIKIIGTKYQLNQALIQSVQEHQLRFFSQLPTQETLQNLRDDLQKQFSQDLDYLVVYCKGNVLYIEYTNKVFNSTKQEDPRVLVACKNGMIDRFEVSSGIIVVNKNQYVQTGELLVDNTLVSTLEQTFSVEPKGKVYAYTWYDKETKKDFQDEVEDYQTLLMQNRQELMKQVGQDAVIDQENILLFYHDESTIRLKVHYTVKENIACKGENNEANQTN